MNYLPQWDRGEIIHKPTQIHFHDGTLKKKKVELYLFHLVGVLGTEKQCWSSWCGFIFFSLKGDTLGPVAWILLLFEDAGQEFNEKEQKDMVGFKTLCTVSTLRYESPLKLSIWVRHHK